MNPLGVYKIVAGHTGYAVIDTLQDRFLFADREFPSEQVAIDALREFSRERGIVLKPIYSQDNRVRAFEAYAIPGRLEMTVTPEFDALLDEMADKIGGTRGQAILKGLMLLRSALKAKEEGKRLAIVDDRENSEEDVDV